MIQTDQLPGVYEIVSIVSDKAGVPIDETAVSGMFTFTRLGRVSLVNASNLSLLAYTGTYSVVGEEIHIHVKSCSQPELNDTTLIRKILTLDTRNLVIEAQGVQSGVHGIYTWKKIAFF